MPCLIRSMASAADLRASSAVIAPSRPSVTRFSLPPGPRVWTT